MGSTGRRKLLLQRELYPDQRGPVRVIETHFAWVFLGRTLAYKLKRPMCQDVMDYRTVAARARGCRNELRLNRRLAPDVYLAVVPIRCRRDGILTLDGSGRIVDWVVKMRRLNVGAMLDRLLLRRAVRGTELSRIVSLLTRFYRHARRRPYLPGPYVAHLRTRMLANLRELAAPDLRLGERAVRSLMHAQLEVLERDRRALGSRGAHVVDGHGDLRPEHVFPGSPPDPPCVIDCLEFDSRLRRLDAAEELAFLSLECRRLGGSRTGADIVREVQSAMRDPVPDSVLFFYMSLRAANRAKVTAWHLRDRSLRPRAHHWRAKARSYLRDSLHFARLALARGADVAGAQHVDEPRRIANSALVAHQRR